MIRADGSRIRDNARCIRDRQNIHGRRRQIRHGAELTSYGAALLKRGVTVFDELREGVKDIEFLVDPTAGRVRIGCNPILATGFVSAVVDRLSRLWPRIVFDVVARPGEMLLAELCECRVDLLVARKLGPLTDPGLDFELLFDEADAVVVGVKNPLGRRRNIDLAGLMNEVWVLPPQDNVVGELALKAFRDRGLDYPRATVFSDSPHVRMSLVAGGRFLSIFPVSILKFPTNHPGIRKLPIELSRRVPVGIVNLKNRTLGSVSRLFIKHAREVAATCTKRK